MPRVFANGRSVIHAGDGNKHVAAPPDVCKTPGPNGAVPVPYPNIAADGDLAKGTKQIKIEGKAAAKADSNLSKSSGDEGGTAGGGLISSKTKGKLTWASSSPTVHFEGKGAVRFMDVTQHNGNTYNAAFVSMGGTGLAYADDFQGKCGICRKLPADHRILDVDSSSGALCQRIIVALRERFAVKGAVTGKERRKWKKGFMVGVMVCKGHDPPWSLATCSSETTPIFTEVARNIVKRVVPGDRVTLDEFINANQSRVPRSRVSSKLTAAYNRAENFAKADGPGYNYVGTCAGAKLLARSGHAPLNMTEMYFRATNRPWSATYSVITNRVMPADAWLRSVLSNALSPRRERRFESMDSVASCHSCQETLYMTMCPERTC